MTILAWIVLFSILGGVLSVLAASGFLLLPEKFRQRMMPHLISFAIGSLLAAAFLALLPHALENPAVTDFHKIMLAVLSGILVFFVLEKMVLWRHCHTHECEAHHVTEGDPARRASGALILIGDSVHNFVDGTLIAAAFLTDIDLGIVTALAVAAHEIPQEVGDFAVLLHSGLSRAKAFFYNLLSSLATLIGGVLAYYGLKDMAALLPYVLAFAASSFIYVAVADLIPGLHKRMHLSATLQQITLISLGVLVIYLAHSSLH